MAAAVAAAAAEGMAAAEEPELFVLLPHTLLFFAC